MAILKAIYESLICRLGLHFWGKWEEVYNCKDNEGKPLFVYQKRICNHCGQSQGRYDQYFKRE